MKTTFSVLLASLALGLVPTHAGTPVEVAAADLSTSNFELVHGGGSVEDYFTFEDGTITVNNYVSHSNFAVTSSDEAIGNYTVSVSGHGTMPYPNSKSVHIGLVPWYLDEDNFLYVYMEWSPSERPTGMRVVEFTGRVNGADPVVWKNGFVQSLWNDAWMDGGNSGNAVEESSNWTFSVEKRRSAGGDTDEFYAYINGNQVGFFGFRDTVMTSSTPAKVGLYAYNDEVTFTNFTVENANTAGLYSVIDEKTTAKSASGAWTIQNGSYAISETSGSPADKTMAVIGNDIVGNYAIEAAVDATMSVGSTVGILGWYLDEYNYLGATLTKLEDGSYKSEIKGVLSDISSTGTLTSVQVEETGTAYPGGSSIATINLEKRGSALYMGINGETDLVSFADSKISTKADVGLMASNVDVSYDFTIQDINYVPYDWYSLSLGGRDLNVKAGTDVNAITYENDVYSFTAEGLSGSSLTSPAAAYYSTNRWENISYSAAFSSVSAASGYGIFPFLTGSESYVAAIVHEGGLRIIDGGEVHDLSLPANYVHEGNHRIESSVEFGMLEIKIDGLPVLENYEILNVDTSLAPYVGFLAFGEPMSVGSLSLDGFAKDSSIAHGDWILSGPRPSTWTFNEDETELVGRYNGGTTFRSTNATYPLEKANSWSAANINIFETTASEWKTGIMPYYLNGDNYIFVWLSQWSGASSMLTITIRLNGKIIGNEWREVSVGYQYTDSDIKLETHIEGDRLEVYLGEKSNPDYSDTIEGLSNRILTGARAGFNINNTSATFSNFSLGADERVYSFTEKPIIQEIGTRLTEVEVGSSVDLPIYTATNSRFDPLTAIVKVTSPSGEEVALDHNSFIADEEGAYHVLVTCIDSWGNEADPIEYDIIATVASSSEPAPDSSTPSTSEPITSTPSSEPGAETPSEGNDNLPVVIGLSVGTGVVVLAIAGVVIYLAIKKRK